MTKRRVVITGIGVTSPHGCNADAMFDALLRGESAVRKIRLESDVGSYETIGAAVPGEPWAALTRAQRVTTDRISQYALLAADAAVRDSGLDIDCLGQDANWCRRRHFAGWDNQPGSSVRRDLPQRGEPPRTIYAGQDHVQRTRGALGPCVQACRPNAHLYHDMFEFGGVHRRGDAEYSARLCGRDDRRRRRGAFRIRID